MFLRAKVLVIIDILLLIQPAGLLAQTVPLPSVSVEKIPSSLEEFIALRDTLARTPQGGAVVFVLALLIYTKNHTLGEQCLVIALDMSVLVEGETYKGYALHHKDRKFIEKYIGKDSGTEYLPNSYVAGTEREKGYALPAGRLTFRFFSQEQKPDADPSAAKVFVASTGADSPRPVSLVRNVKGIWKATNWRSLLVSIKPPPRPDDL